MIAAILFWAASAAAEPLSDRIQREYTLPALAAVQEAVAGRASTWTPPVLPGSAQTRALTETILSLWIEPLFQRNAKFAMDAARYLASPELGAPPAEPAAPAYRLPDLLDLAPAAARIVSEIERRCLKPVFPTDEISSAAAELARPQISAPPQDSTRLVRGGSGTPRPKLKKLETGRTRFNLTP